MCSTFASHIQLFLRSNQAVLKLGSALCLTSLPSRHASHCEAGPSIDVCLVPIGSERGVTPD